MKVKGVSEDVYNGTRITDLRWQECLSKYDSGRACDPSNPQNRCKPSLYDPQNSFSGPRALNNGAVRQEHRDLNRSDDEQTRGEHPELRARSSAPGEEP